MRRSWLLWLLMHGLVAILRLVVVTLSLTAWFSATNHCVLAAPVQHAANVAAGNEDMPADCPMHAQKQPPPQHEQGNGCGDLPCCQKLPAAAPVVAKLVASPLWLGALVAFYAPHVGETRAAKATSIPFTDTGPPGGDFFVELVLQRSVLAHAPPVSLS